MDTISDADWCLAFNQMELADMMATLAVLDFDFEADIR